MSDMMQKMPPQQPPMGQPPQGPMGQPPMGGPSAVEKNMSIFNPKDFAILFTQIRNNPEMPVRDFLMKLGIDVDGPVAQITEWLTKSVENVSPLGAMKNISAAAGGDAALGPGGQPPTMPGRKPMVQPPGRPAPAGMEGLLNKLGG